MHACTRARTCTRTHKLIATGIWTTHDEHMVVFSIVPNLVRINAVVLIICRFQYFVCYASKLKKPIHAPIIGVLGDLIP